MSSRDANGSLPNGSAPVPTRSVVDDLGVLVHEVMAFGTTVGTSVAQLDGHKDTLDGIKRVLDAIEEEKRRANDLKQAEERRLDARGGRDHEFRMRILHGLGGMLTGIILPALTYQFTGWTPSQTNCPPPAVEVQNEPSP